MPMLGVMRLILDREDGSARGDEDFFSVARTMPFVATMWVRLGALEGGVGDGGLTLDAESCYALVDSVESIFYRFVRNGCAYGSSKSIVPRRASWRTDQFEPACRCAEGQFRSVKL